MWSLLGKDVAVHRSIIPAICVCVCLCVCLRPPFLDDRRSDLIETCQEYCRGPADVPFRGLISIGRAVLKLRPFTCQPMTGHGAMTSWMTSQLIFNYFCMIDVTILLLRLVWRHNRRWGPEYVPFQGLISSSSVSAVSQVFPKCFPRFESCFIPRFELIVQIIN